MGCYTPVPHSHSRYEPEYMQYGCPVTKEYTSCLQGHFTVGLVGSASVGSSEMRMYGSHGALVISFADSSLRAVGEGGKVLSERLLCWFQFKRRVYRMVTSRPTAPCHTVVTLFGWCRRLRQWQAKAMVLLWSVHMRWASGCSAR
jgi:hypothetical protein